MFKPTPIMEGALARRLRALPSLRQQGLVVSLGTGGGVILSTIQGDIGAWRWTGCEFVFAYNDEVRGRYVAQTLAGAAAYSMIVLDDYED